MDVLFDIDWTFDNGENTSRVFSGSDLLKYVKVALSQKKTLAPSSEKVYLPRILKGLLLTKS